MLKKLIVKNFAIIEDIEVEFTEKMTCLTGETGAGKSLIIDSISLLLGARSRKDMIRYGSTDALIVGTFSNPNSRVLESLNEYGIILKDDLIIERHILLTFSKVGFNHVISFLFILICQLNCRCFHIRGFSFLLCF